MHVAIVGAGALGRLFGVALHRAGARVTLVGREHSGVEAFRVQRQSPGAATYEVQLSLTRKLPEADIYVIAIRGDQLQGLQGDALLASLKARESPVVALSPALPQGIAQLRQRLPNIALTLPAVAARWHADRELLHYWSSRFAKTLIEEGDPKLGTLVECLNRGGIPTKLTHDVATHSSATTIAFFPLQVALGAVNSLRSWPKHGRLMRNVTAALRECRQLAGRLGRIDPGISILTRFASQAWLLRLGCLMVPTLLPRLTEFLQFHFGPKLLGQHQLFTAQIEELSAEHGLIVPHLRALMDQAQQSHGTEPAEEP